MNNALPIGTLVDSVDGSPATLDPTRFNRHTFWCGQSGSGKTYALGVVLEQLLLRTRLPLLVMDPNADFVRLGEVRDDVDAEVAKQLAEIRPRVFRPGSEGDDRLSVKFVDLNLRSRAAVLRLDPLKDPEEYNVLLHLEKAYGPATFDRATLLQRLTEAKDPGLRRLLMRLENLGVLDWDVWAWGGGSTQTVIDERQRATVLDLGGFKNPDESKVAALGILDHLWAHRESRRPVLIVIDEAHNLCPADPLLPVEVALTERIVQIAAEGRKYGLWLLLSTQRPSKIHPNALSQCDNLGLMKMTSPRDLDELGQYFGYAPHELLARSATFAQGQALFAGGFIKAPAVVQVAQRLTEEGGSDVRVPL
ncbi:ATP-binding protein [Mumia zhuanghuii]|uniref:ATP-binding protein n=1 Tax=Mumia zhuanghuii TaxID=2585211 RepID=A0A5C4N2N4_9ACTN|nr:ATP-binding protein [Mumia zhuanghuii]TNC51774.1 ATP-binding protein [Mumia zhuanghuii]TNC52114.1 ATP-binding protein [Mumia zhuanghuii]